MVLIFRPLFRVSLQHSSLSQQVCDQTKFARISNKQKIYADKKGMSFVVTDLWQEISFNFKSLNLSQRLLQKHLKLSLIGAISNVIFFKFLFLSFCKCAPPFVTFIILTQTIWRLSR